jgi:hypothetical protein
MGTSGGKNGTNGAGSLHLDDPEDDENGGPPAPPSDPPEPPSPPPPQVAELCAAAMRFVAHKYKVALDGTPETLSLVDQYVRDARDAVRERPESIDLVAPAVGAYFGEVARQAFGAEWYAEGDHDAWRLYFKNVYVAFNPIGVGREALTMRDEEGWHAHLTLDPGEKEIIEERLAVMPQVDEEEYYLPTTRLEVLTVVVETLRARAEASGMGDVVFTREDYD